MLRLIDQIPLKDRRLFIRTDFNTPLKDGKVADDTRIKESLPTIQWAINQGAKIIIGSHLGRPKGSVQEKFSLMPVAAHLSEMLNKDIIFPELPTSNAVKKLVSELRSGEIILLENLRFVPEEEANDDSFARHLASLADVYVNDAFGVLHRAHASTAGMVSHFKDKGIGFLVQKELAALDGLMKNTKKPFLAILGGAKVADKISVIENLMNHVDVFIIGGGMAYTFLRAQGMEIGQSLVDETKIHQAARLLERAKNKGVRLILPIDSLAAMRMEAGVPTRVVNHGESWTEGAGFDIGPASHELFNREIGQASTIFWNGPMGVFEIPDFAKGTMAVALAVASNRGVSVVGGGDSVAAVKKSGYADRIHHLCTGGGAALEYLEGKKLPGLQALEQ